MLYNRTFWPVDVLGLAARPAPVECKDIAPVYICGSRPLNLSYYMRVGRRGCGLTRRVFHDGLSVSLNLLSSGTTGVRLSCYPRAELGQGRNRK